MIGNVHDMSFGRLPGGSFVQRRLIPRHDPAAKKPKIPILSLGGFHTAQMPSPWPFNRVATSAIHSGVMRKGWILQWHSITVWDWPRATAIQALTIDDFSGTVKTPWAQQDEVGVAGRPADLFDSYIFFRSACRQPGKWICIEHAISGSIESWLKPELGRYDSVW